MNRRMINRLCNHDNVRSIFIKGQGSKALYSQAYEGFDYGISFSLHSDDRGRNKAINKGLKIEFYVVRFCYAQMLLSKVV